MLEGRVELIQAFVVREVCSLGVEPHVPAMLRLAIDPVQYHHLHVVAQHRLRHTFEELKHMAHILEQRLRILALRGLLQIPANRFAIKVQSTSDLADTDPPSACSCCLLEKLPSRIIPNSKGENDRRQPHWGLFKSRPNNAKIPLTSASVTSSGNHFQAGLPG